jgi:hypothetical protein
VEQNFSPHRPGISSPELSELELGWKQTSIDCVPFELVLTQGELRRRDDQLLQIRQGRAARTIQRQWRRHRQSVKKAQKGKKGAKPGQSVKKASKKPAGSPKK